VPSSVCGAKKANRKIMKYSLLLLLIVLKTDQVQFARLHQLEGTWIREKDNNRLYEQWQKKSAGEMVGRSYTINKTDTVLVETMLLQHQNQKIVFTATDVMQPQQGATTFTLNKVERNSFFFENRQHDYPKRVVYELVSKDSLHAWIDGGRKEKDSRVDFYFSRLQ
jgi:Domain of unknown function (DUF6265)